MRTGSSNKVLHFGQFSETSKSLTGSSAQVVSKNKNSEAVKPSQSKATSDGFGPARKDGFTAASKASSGVVRFEAQAPVTMENVIRFLQEGPSADPSAALTQRFALDRLELLLPDDLKRAFLDDIKSVMSDTLFDAGKSQLLSDAAYYVKNPNSSFVDTFKFPDGSQEVLRTAFQNLDARLRTQAPDVLNDFSACFRGQKTIELDPQLTSFQELGYRPWRSTPPVIDDGTAAPPAEEGFNFNQILDGVQVVLDLVGLIPGVGELADATNAGVSVARGDFIGAALSAISLMPIVGDAIGKSGKFLLGATKTAEGLKAARGTAEQFLKLVGKTDFATFFQSLKGAFEKVPQLAGKVDEALAGVGKGLDEVVSTIADKFGLPKPAFAIDGSGGGLNRPPPRSPADISAAQKAVGTYARAAADVVTQFASKRAPKALSDAAALADQKFLMLVSNTFGSNAHLKAHVLTGSASEQAEFLQKQLAARFGKFSLFADAQAPKDAAAAALQRLKDIKGVDLSNPGTYPSAVKALAKGESVIENGVKYARNEKSGALSATLDMGFETGTQLTLEAGGKIAQKACNAVCVVMREQLDGLTTVFPAIF
jgi:hypothetical protein